MFYVRRSALSALLVFALAACSLTREPEQKAGVEELTAALQALIDSVVADPTIPGALLYAESPRLGLEWSGAARRGDRSGAPSRRARAHRKQHEDLEPSSEPT